MNQIVFHKIHNQLNSMSRDEIKTVRLRIFKYCIWLGFIYVLDT